MRFLSRSVLIKLWPLGVGLIVLTVYLLTGARTYSWANYGNDGADLAAAIATSGIPHPPGFPLYLLLGKVATLVLPLSDFMWRLNVFSAIGGALAVMFIALASYQFTRSRLAATVGALAYGLAILPWGQATITEVSTWLAVFGAGCLYALGKAKESSRPVWLLLAWLCGGLAIAIHPIGLVTVPTILWFMWLYRAQMYRRWWFYPASILALFIPLCLYTLPYLRSQGESSYIWAEVGNLRELWWYTSFQEYWSTVNFGQVIYYLRGTGKFFIQIIRNFGILGAVLALFGLVKLWQEDRQQLKFLVGAIILFAAPVVIHNENPVLGGYYALVLLPWALVLAGGARKLFSYVAYIPSLDKSWSVGWLALLVPAVLIISNWSVVDARADNRFPEMMERVAPDVASNALIITFAGLSNELDEVAFGLRYGFLVHTPRPDVVVVVNVGGKEELPMLRRRFPQYDWSNIAGLDASGDNDPLAGERIARFVATNKHLGPIYFVFGNRPRDQSLLLIGQTEFHALPHGLLYEVR